MAMICAVAYATAYAREVMTMTNGEELEVEIVTMGTDDITYRKASNPNGPTYTISRSKVFFITFDNGAKEIITPQQQSVASVGNENNSGKTTLANTLLQASMAKVEQNAAPKKNYFPGLTFFPHVSLGFHATPSGYKDQYDID